MKKGLIVIGITLLGIICGTLIEYLTMNISGKYEYYLLIGGFVEEFVKILLPILVAIYLLKERNWKKILIYVLFATITFGVVEGIITIYSHHITESLQILKTLGVTILSHIGMYYIFVLGLILLNKILKSKFWIITLSFILASLSHYTFDYSSIKYIQYQTKFYNFISTDLYESNYNNNFAINNEFSSIIKLKEIRDNLNEMLYLKVFILFLMSITPTIIILTNLFSYKKLDKVLEFN